MQAPDDAVLHSPSFNSNSNSSLTEIAARVVEECAAEEKSDEFFYDEFYFEREVVSESVKREGEEWDEDEGGGFEFEFEFGKMDSESSTISADEIFQDGKILPVYPFLKGDLLIRKVKMDVDKEESGKKKIRLPLMKLLNDEREATAASAAATSSCSSSEVDELEGVPEELYCVWQPKDADEQEGAPEEMYCVWQPKTTPTATNSPAETARRCKKSSSTGYIYKKLKLKELLLRSHSEGRKNSFVFLAPKNSKVEDTPPVAIGKLRLPPPRRTYLPYRQDLVGFFSGGNRLSTKNSKPF